MSHEALTSVERLAQRLLDGGDDAAGYHELRAEALVQAHAWATPWLAAELLATFERAERDHRSLPETAAIVQGLVRAARLAISHPAQSKVPAWTNPALVAAGITAAAMIAAALINHWGEMGKKPVPGASIPAAILKPNIQIVMPTSAAQAPQTVILQQPAASAKPAAAATAATQTAAPPATHPAEAPAAPAAEGQETRQP